MNRRRSLLWLIVVCCAFLLVSCNPHEEGQKICSDQVRFEILNSENLEPDLCYEEMGRIRMVLYNSGTYPIESFVVTIIGDEGIFNKEMPIRLPVDTVVPVDITFAIAELGTIQDLVIYPRVRLSDGKTGMCESNSRHMLSIKSCV